MKKLLAVIAIFSFITVSNVNVANAQEGTNTGTTTEATPTETAPAATTTAVEEEVAPAPVAEEGFHEIVKRYFIEGGATFMSFVLVCLILGLAFVIERIISLNLATTNTRKLLIAIEDRVKAGDINGAKELCRAQRGPVASIFYQGLDRINEGAEAVEKSIIAYGGVQMGLLERGLPWISLFIALAPMLGFMGTVIGMIGAFDAIAAAGDINPTIVASGIKVALLTTVFGLIVAIILQVFYNYIMSKIDSIINNMEDASISFMDILLKYNVFNKRA
ncbi:MotA/TolQ/ExbB proton channel family protein [soil metagenome]